MGIKIVIGGQYGSEGKGKVVYNLAKYKNIKYIIRPGGPNSGHTIEIKNKKIIFRHLSPACLLSNVKTILPAGSYLNYNVLLNEIKENNIPDNKILIDPYAYIIGKSNISNEKDISKSISSTQSGIGDALKERISRKNNIFCFAKDIKFLNKYIIDRDKLYKLYDKIFDSGNSLIIEGTQGFGLSLLHSEEYPYVTGRDTTAAGFLSECGLSPNDVDEIIMVIRSYPIRVGGNSGFMKNEITWDEIEKRSGYPYKLEEYTSVTKKLRRVAEFDKELVKQAISINNPNTIVMNHLDYIDYQCKELSCITNIAQKFINKIEKQINRKIDYVGINGNNLLVEKL